MGGTPEESDFPEKHCWVRNSEWLVASSAADTTSTPLGAGEPSPARMSQLHALHTIHWPWAGSLYLAMGEVCTTKIGIYLELDIFFSS